MSEKYLEHIKRGCLTDDISEDTLRERVITRLIEALGYDVDKEVEYEKSIRIGSNNSIRMDYVIGAGKKRFVLEAKSPKEDIDDYKEQLLSYIRVSLIDYGILYNGKRLLLLNKDLDDPVYEWRCGYNSDIFGALRKEVFPKELDLILKKEGRRAVLEKYIKEKFSHITTNLIEKISKETGLEKEYIFENLDIDASLKPLIPEETKEDNHISYETGEVIVTASTDESECGGINFIRNTGGWGFVPLNQERRPKYLALYEAKKKAITHVFKVRAIKRGDSSIMKDWKGCKSGIVGQEEYLKGRRVFLVLGDEVKPFNPVPAKELFIRGSRFIKSLDDLLNAKSTKEILP